MTLNDICELIVDCPHSTAKDEGAGYPLIRTPNIGRGRLILDDVHRVSKEVYDKRNARAVPQDDDLILAREAPAGNVAIIKNGEKVCLGQRTVLIRPDKKKVYPDFLAYYILAPQQQYELLGTANGATVAHVNIPVIKALPIELPSMEAQVKAADAMKAYDDLIDNNQNQISLLEEVAQRVYKEWFIDLHFPGHEEVEKISGVPAGWQKRPLGKALKVVRGRSYSSKELSEKEGLLMINLSNIRPYGGYNRDQEKRYTGKYNDDQLVETHDLLMGVTDMTQERRTVGRVAIVPNLHAKAMISMDLIKLVPIEGSPLFYYALLNYGGYSEVVSRFANGTNVLHLRPDVLDIIDVVIPDAKLQRLFVDFFENIQDCIDMLQDKIIIAEEARDRLLPRLMSGEIEL